MSYTIMNPIKFGIMDDVLKYKSAYLKPLLYDYEEYVLDYRTPVSIEYFLGLWTIMHPHDFRDLMPGDKFYDVYGNMWEVNAKPAYDCDNVLYVIGETICDDRTITVNVFKAGQIYYYKEKSDVSNAKKIERKTNKQWLKSLIISKKELPS